MSGNYQIRTLDVAERFIWLLDRISRANFVVMAEIAGHPIDEDTLRRGLDRVQANHPLLSATVQQAADGSVAFYREEGARIALHIEQRSEDDWNEVIEREFAAPFDTPGAPLARCNLLNLPNRCVLVLTFHHAIADGRSGMARLRELLRLCLRGVEQPGESEAPPPLHSLFPAEFQWHSHPPRAAEIGQQMLQEFARHGAPDALSFLDDQETRREPKFRQVRFGNAQSRAIQARCKAEGTTIHGAVCTAYLLATRDLFGDDAAKTLYLMCPVDMRGYLASDIGDGVSYCTSFLRSNYRVEQGADFWSMARVIVTDFRARLARGDAHLMYAALPLDKIGPSGPAFDAFAAQMAQLPAGSNISTLGRIPLIEDCPEVQAITGALCSMPRHLASLYASSYNDELVISMTYDGAKIAPEAIDRLTDSLKALLGQAVEVPETLA